MSRARQDNPNRKSTFLTIAAAVSVAVIAVSIIDIKPKTRARFVCNSNMRQLAVVMAVYSEEHNGMYPPPEKWCDAMKKYWKAPILLECPGHNNKRGKSNYALNPNVDSNSPDETVLLFETKAGWNQHGGRELLTLDNHRRKGCHVLFKDFSVSFVDSNEIDNLNWGEHEE